MSLPSLAAAPPPPTHKSADSTSTTGNFQSSQPNSSAAQHASQGRLPPTTSSSSAEFSSQIDTLKAALRQYPDFPSPGILFEDIMPLFADHNLHETLIKALESQVRASCGESQKPDVVVGLEARGFLFGPSLALRLGAGFVPVRKQGKLPGETETESYEKEYGRDFFQIQKGGIKPGQRVIIVDDIIATGGSAVAAGSLVKKLGGTLIGYLFMMELDFLKGREKLDAPVYTLLSSQ